LAVDETILAELLLSGLAHLRAGRPDDAVQVLAAVAQDEVFAAAADLDDVQARAWSLYAQALMRAGKPKEALPWCERALRITRALGDEAGLAEVRALHTELREALTAEAADRKAREHSLRLAGLTVDQILVGLGSALDRADALIQKANAEIQAGHLREADPIARMALVEAVQGEGVREEVLARIAIATVAPEEARVELTAAWRRAERAGEFNLVSAVARAAELARVALPTLVGPET
jgi:tetratricopeptide (TPR) repeat protein